MKTAPVLSNGAMSTPSGLDTVRVADAMHFGVVTCAQETPLAEVARIMATERLHCVVVADDLDAASSLWGLISDLDLVAAAGVRALDDQMAEGSAASPAVTVSPAETLQRAAQLMTEYGAAHLIVIDPVSTRPIGVLSTLDIATTLAALARR